MRNAQKFSRPDSVVNQMLHVLQHSSFHTHIQNDTLSETQVHKIKTIDRRRTVKNRSISVDAVPYPWLIRSASGGTVAQPLETRHITAIVPSKTLTPP